MLVLLIIFMVTAPMMQQGLQVNLPQARRAKPVNAQPIYVTVPADFSRNARRAARQGGRADRDPAGARAQALLMRERQVGVHPRRRAASMQDLMTVIDKLKEAGVEKVGLMTQPAQTR